MIALIQCHPESSAVHRRLRLRQDPDDLARQARSAWQETASRLPWQPENLNEHCARAEQNGGRPQESWPQQAGVHAGVSGLPDAAEAL